MHFLCSALLQLPWVLGVGFKPNETLVYQFKHREMLQRLELKRMYNDTGKILYKLNHSDYLNLTINDTTQLLKDLNTLKFETKLQEALVYGNGTNSSSGGKQTIPDTEECDDRNLDRGDGCDNNCMIEVTESACACTYYSS